MARITFTTMYDTTMRNLQRNANKLNKLEEQIASETTINRPSDNPVGFSNTMTYKNILNSLMQKRINMDDGENYMSILETTHASMNNIFVRSQELAVQAANDTENHEQRVFTNMEVRQNLEQLVALSQTKHKDGYMFSGKWTNQPPYEIKNGQSNYIDPLTNTLRPDITANVPVNPPPGGPGDPTRPFESTLNPKIQLFDSAYIDPNIKPFPDNPMVQRIIPGSFQLDGLLEKPYKNTDLDPEHPDYDKPDYEVDYVNGTITLLSEKAKEAFYDPTTGNFRGNAAPEVSFEYIYRNSIDMSGEIYRELDSGIKMKINSNPDDLFGMDGQANTDSFKEMISLMQGLWYNDQAEINRGIETVDTARKRNITEQAVEGARLNRIGIVYDRNLEVSINDTDARYKIEGVDLADALSQFSMSNAVYTASLQAAARLMQPSLMDFL